MRKVSQKYTAQIIGEGNPAKWTRFHQGMAGSFDSRIGRLVGCRWVFKVKRNGVYCARLVAKGFSQFPGVDFTDNYSPVVNDVTFRKVVARMIIENMKGKW